MPTRLSMSATDWLLLVVLSVLGGGSFFFAKIAVTELPPLTLALCRVGIAAAILAVLSRASGTSLESSLRTCRPFAVLGLLNSALPHTLIFWGKRRFQVRSLRFSTQRLRSSPCSSRIWPLETRSSMQKAMRRRGGVYRRGRHARARCTDHRRKSLGAVRLPRRRTFLCDRRSLWPQARAAPGANGRGRSTDRRDAIPHARGCGGRPALDPRHAVACGGRRSAGTGRIIDGAGT
jgi:hypothetical protein